MTYTNSVALSDVLKLLTAKPDLIKGGLDGDRAGEELIKLANKLKEYFASEPEQRQATIRR